MRPFALVVAAAGALALLLSLPLHAQDIPVKPHTVVVKLTAASAAAGSLDQGGSVRAALASYGVSTVSTLLQNADAPVLAKPRSERQAADMARWNAELKRIFRVTYASDDSPWAVAADLSHVAGVEYAEPYFLYTTIGPAGGAVFPAAGPEGTAAIPNDSLYVQQGELRALRAEQAWDITQGDSSIVVAVVDGDLKWDHPDLEPNVWINPGESGLDNQGRDKRTNGVDDDNNGKIDDWHGWDFSGADDNSPDNDTRSTQAGHGTSVAGLIGAATNNRIGIASIGNRCKLLPVKVGPDAGGNLSYAYDGIDYASRMGARVCNASWGSFGYSKALEDVISATVSRGMVIVGGAGNHGGPAPFYPGAYPAVLDAGSCDTADVISTVTGYGPALDVLSPSTGALSTNTGNAYSRWGGETSASAPVASGVAALVASKYTNYTAEQIRERVRATCDNIDAKNPAKARYAGKGRMNAFRAVSDTPTPSIRILSYTVTDPDNDGRLDPGEDIVVSVTLKNYLDATEGGVELTAVPISNAANVSLTQATATLPAMAAGETATHEAFRFTVQPSTNYDAVVMFRIDIRSGTYDDFDFVSAAVNPSFQNMFSGPLMLTIQANGMFGYKDYPTNTLGNGMKYGTADCQLYLGSAMIGTDVGHIVDCARATGDFLSRANDFRNSGGVILEPNMGGAAMRATSQFTDANADSARRLHVDVKHEVFDFSNRGITGVLFSKYTVRNTGTATLQGVRFGLFMDFGGYPQYYIATVTYDSTRRLAYLGKGGGIPVVGTFVIDSLQNSDPKRATFWGINNDHRVTQGNPFGTLDGFTYAERWMALSSYAGNRAPAAGNLAYVLTAPQTDIAPGAEAVFVFGHIANPLISSMQNIVSSAIAFWRNPGVMAADAADAAPRGLAIESVYPNPVSAADGGIAVTYTAPAGADCVVELYNTLGVRIATLASGRVRQASQTVRAFLPALPAGLYFVHARSGASVRTAPLVVAR